MLVRLKDLDVNKSMMTIRHFFDSDLKNTRQLSWLLLIVVLFSHNISFAADSEQIQVQRISQLTQALTPQNLPVRGSKVDKDLSFVSTDEVFQSLQTQKAYPTLKLDALLAEPKMLQVEGIEEKTPLMPVDKAFPALASDKSYPTVNVDDFLTSPKSSHKTSQAVTPEKSFSFLSADEVFQASPDAKNYSTLELNEVLNEFNKGLKGATSDSELESLLRQLTQKIEKIETGQEDSESIAQNLKKYESQILSIIKKEKQLDELLDYMGRLKKVSVHKASLPVQASNTKVNCDHESILEYTWPRPQCR